MMLHLTLAEQPGHCSECGYSSELWQKELGQGFIGPNSNRGADAHREGIYHAYSIL